MARLGLVRYHGFRGLRLVKGFMQHVWSDSGERYLDFHTGHGVAFLGHSNPAIVGAVARQARELMVASQSFSTPALEEALDAFSSISPRWASEIAFLNTGAEAVEAALKAAWLYTGRRRIVAFRGSFHGRTLGALSATWRPAYRRGLPVLGDTVFLEYNMDPAMVESSVPKDTAAIIVEPVLGEGGVVPAEPEFLKALREAADSRDAVLIFDEVQTGFGRTGSVWAHEQAGVEPDIMTAGKSIAGGLPASAVLSRDGVLERLSRGMHGSTHAGNPLAMAAITAAVGVLRRDDVPGRALRAGAHLAKSLSQALEGVRVVRRVRASGLMVGVEFRLDPSGVIRCLQEERRLLALKAGVTTLRMLPPYMVSSEDVEEAVESVGHCVCRQAGC